MQNIINLYKDFKNSLILNPTENIPFEYTESISFVEGLYIPEDIRTSKSKVIFAGRNIQRDAMTEMYRKWELAMNSKASSFKLYSGLHAHIILFMSIGNIGDKILILPESAGGHYATHKLLSRLGMQVKECIADYSNRCIDINKTEELIEFWKPKFIFIDRSDGLYYEDFCWLNKYSSIYKIFDASQYLTHILANDYKNPFDMGFDLILTSLHKNYPGPQQAAFFTKEQDVVWSQISSGLSSYVSNSHPLEIFKAGITFPNKEFIKTYSSSILNNTIALEESLNKNGIPTIKRDKNKVQTQQIWIRLKNDDSTYELFKKMEQIHLYANYRELPYNLGKGIRIGTAAATRQGLDINSAISIGKLIGVAHKSSSISHTLIDKTLNYINEIKTNK